MCNVKSNLKKHCTAVHKIKYPPAGMKRIQIVGQLKGDPDTAVIDNSAGNSGSSEAVDMAGSERTACKTMHDQRVEDRYLEESKVGSSADTTRRIVDQQHMDSKSHTVNARLVTENDEEAGNFLLFINECGTTSDIQHKTSRSDVFVGHNMVVMPSNPPVIQRTKNEVVHEEVQAYVGDNVCELRFDQV